MFDFDFLDYAPVSALTVAGLRDLNNAGAFVTESEIRGIYGLL